MNKTKGPFNYLLIKMEGNEPIPFNPHIEIVLGFTFTASDDSGPRLSGHLMTEKEIDTRIQQLKADLDAVGERAKQALRKAQGQARRYKSN